MFIRGSNGDPSGGIKMANGTNPQGDPPFPGSRGKSAALVRQQFIKALEYRDKIARAGNDPDKKPARDLGLEAIVEALEGKRVVHHHTHRADDIMTVLRLKEEFGFRVVLHHVSEAWKVADEIAKANVPCSMIIVDSPGGKLEAAELTSTPRRFLRRQAYSPRFIPTTGSPTAGCGSAWPGWVFARA
jgi:imidazolonepropionase-like amidohydrolase